MNDQRMYEEELWQRASRGRHTAVLGLPLSEPSASLGLRVVRVSCDVPTTTLGPLLDAAQKVEQILGGPVPLLDQAKQRVVSGLRRRLLGEVPGSGPDGTLVETLNRLAKESDRCSVLVFDAVDSADEATLEALRYIVVRSGWLKLPLVLAFRSRAPSGAAAALVEAIRVTEGEDAVLMGDPPEVSPETTDEIPNLSLRSLAPDVLRVVRAGAIVGSGFEAELIAALLRMNPLDVLDCLQRAADAGIPIEDRGEGRFHLPEKLLLALRASVLPSITLAWHRRLASILTEAPPAIEPNDRRQAAPPSAAEVAAIPAIKRAVSGEPQPDIAPQGSRPHVELGAEAMERAPDAQKEPLASPRFSVANKTDEAAAPAPRASDDRRAVAIRDQSGSEEPTGRGLDPREHVKWHYAELFGEGPGAEATVQGAQGAVTAAANDASEDGARAKNALEDEDPSRPHGGGAPRQEGHPKSMREILSNRGNEARAAGHLTAAGEMDAAAEQYFGAARKAAEMGAYPHALAYSKKALSVLEHLPLSTRRRRLRARVLAELGRIQWHAAGPDLSFTLSDALAVLDEARALLQEDDPPELHAEVAVLVANVCYDIGDMRALERALDALTHASRLLLSAHDATGAARLLNDQAAVYVRMGDPVRATHLLGESRKVFEQRAGTDPVAMIELAETDHLLAHIPLHVPARPGREADALSMGLDHAIAAERTYKKLNARRELGRVWETMGRLELKRGRLERAADRLSGAMQLQEALGDVLGLARTTAALSEVLAAGGRYREALTVLADSVALNLEKGSPIGLAFNRRSLDALARSAPGGVDITEALKEVAARLVAAETILGRTPLPGDRS